MCWEQRETIAYMVVCEETKESEKNIRKLMNKVGRGKDWMKNVVDSRKG